jgi:glycosyltransferase involved in cell wall biosynthesis
MKCSIVVLCYNEEKNLPLIVSRFAEVLTRPDVEIILVNNGSNDDSAMVMESLKRDNTFLKVVEVPKNLGYGFGVLSGLRESKAEFLGWTHADMQTDPLDSLLALELLERDKNPDQTMVKGLRQGRNLWDNFFTLGMSIFESLYLEKFLWDINAQPNLFPRSFFDSWLNPPHDFSLDLYVLYQARVMGLTLKRLPVNFPPRIHGSSSWNTGIVSRWKFIKRTILFSLHLKREISRH